MDFAFAASMLTLGTDQCIGQSLVVTLPMVMRHEFSSCFSHQRAAKIKGLAVLLARPIESAFLIISYFGQGTAERVSAVSSGKLKAPSIALELPPISNHGNKASVCG